MPLVRVKHDDPTARISFATENEPDEKGGFLVEQRHVEELAFNGWRVAHLEHEEVAEAVSEPEKATPVEEAAPVEEAPKPELEPLDSLLKKAQDKFKRK